MAAATDHEDLSRLLTALVDHYVQPIHSIGQDALHVHNIDDGIDDDDDDDDAVLSPFGAAIQEQILRAAASSNDKNGPPPRWAALVLLSLYKSHVRDAALYAPRVDRHHEKRFSPYGAAVLVHYRQLVTALLRHHNNHDDCNDHDYSGGFLQQQEQGHDEPTTTILLKHEAIMESLLCLANDVTAIQDTSAMAQDDNNDEEATSTAESKDWMRNTILQDLLRLMQELLRAVLHCFDSKPGQPSSTSGVLPPVPSLPIDTARRCFISLMPFCAPPSYDAMEPRVISTLFDLPSYTNHPLRPEAVSAAAALERPMSNIWRIVGLHRSALTTTSAAARNPAVFNLATKVLHQLDELCVAALPVAKPTKPSFVVAIVPDDNNDDNNNKDGSERSLLPGPNNALSACCCRLISALGGREELARSVRAHFFGRDIQPDDQVVPETRRRLHLGKTITETVHKDHKHYQSNPSRILVALAFISLTTSISSSSSSASLEDMVPIVYELINSASADLVQWGSVVLFRLLEASPLEVWRGQPILCDNLVQMLHSEIQSQRDGATLALLGLAQARLFRAMLQDNNDDVAQGIEEQRHIEKFIHHRRKATQQWLMILHQNNFCFTKNNLIWGVLYGGILPNTSDHAKSPTLDCLEIGRLGLQALLPVLQQGLESDEWTGNDDEDDAQHLLLSSKDRQLMKSAIHRGALIALSNVFLAAHPLMQRHQGKILCTMVAFMRKSGPTSVNYDLVESVAAMAYQMGASNKVTRDAVMNRIITDHDAGVGEIMTAIQRRSCRLVGSARKL